MKHFLCYGILQRSYIIYVLFNEFLIPKNYENDIILI